MSQVIENLTQLVGTAIRRVYQADGTTMQAQNVAFDVSMLLTGQIRGEAMRLFQIYAAGNFIEATPDTPFLQIGEHKYGKPILDRVARAEMRLGEAAKLILLSFDSTLRSNLSVGMPIDILIYERDTLDVKRKGLLGGHVHIPRTMVAEVDGRRVELASSARDAHG